MGIQQTRQEIAHASASCTASFIAGGGARNARSLSTQRLARLQSYSRVSLFARIVLLLVLQWFSAAEHLQHVQLIIIILPLKK